MWPPVVHTLFSSAANWLTGGTTQLSTAYNGCSRVKSPFFADC